MEMKIEIYKNGEKVNEINSTDAMEIYKKVAQIYNAKENKRTSRTTIQTGWNEILSATETYNQDKSSLMGVKYKYIYTFKGVQL